MVEDSYHTLRVPARPLPPAIADLPVRALSRPRHTLTVAERVLANSRDLGERSFAAQARGIALRELGDVHAALRQLQSAAGEAAEVGDARLADVEASLAVTLVVAGRTRDALTRLDAALGTASGPAAARIRVRRGSLLGELGRPVEAATELRAAARTLRRAGDVTWESRALLNLAQAHIEMGDTTRADAILAQAEQLLIGSERSFEAASARQKRSIVATLEGRVPDALAHLDQAEAWLADAGTQSAELHGVRADALLSAGLFADALGSAEAAVAQLRRPGSSPTYRASALVRASQAALAVGNAQLARDHAREAGRLFAAHGLERGRTQARLGAARARYAGGERNRRLLHELAALADDAARQRMVEAFEAHLLAGELALEIDERATAARHLAIAGRARRHRSDLSKVLGWRAAALSAGAAGRDSVLLNACDRGLQVLDHHQLTLGATETRVAATTHGRPLVAMALRAALRTGDPRVIFRWSDRWRATALALPPVRHQSDAEFTALLARLRLTRSRIGEATLTGQSVAGLERDLRELEDQVRRHALRTSAIHSDAARRADVDELLAGLGEARVVEIFSAGDVVHVLVATATSVRHHVAGRYSTAKGSARLAEFALRQAAGPTPPAFVRTALRQLGSALEKQLLGDAAADLDGGPVVVVPPGELSSAPWGLLPSLRSRAFSVAPSAATWLAARRTVPVTGGVTLVAGPRLQNADSEIDAVAARYPGATVIHADAADTDDVLAALDGATLAHIAAHGAFRSDNPMFSSLTMRDGPLTVFDLQRLERAPYRLVLSSCNTGAAAASGADELLGMISALIPLGTAGLVASPAPVSDEAAVPFATAVHTRLAAGESTAEALCAARSEAADELGAMGLACSFIPFGAA